jgi:hypothetical protein
VPKPLDASKRDAILKDIRAGVKARNQIARDHGVSPSTVTKIAKDFAITDAFDRSNLKDALQAKAIDDKAYRRATSRRFLEKCNQMLDQMDQPHLVFAFGGRDNTYAEHVLDRAPTGDLRNLMVTAATAFDKHLAADKHDADQTESMASVDQWLDSLTAGEGH